MPRKHSLAAFVATLICLAVAAPASASHGCSKHARGGKVTHKTKEAHVFEKRDRWYGCAARVGRPYALPGLDSISAGREFGDGTVPSHITLAGVFVAYERYTLYPAGGAGDTQTDIYVVDLRTGKVVVSQQAADPEPQQESRWVDDLILKRNGSIGWTSTRWTYPTGSPPVPTYRVHRYSVDPSAPGRATLDTIAEGDRQSLTLSADRRTMSWTNNGQPRSAPLP